MQAQANSPNDRETLLSIEAIGLRFGGVRALDDVSMDVREGEVFAIIGPNGAGKTSLLNSISGLYRPQGGRMILSDAEGRQHDLRRERPHQIARLGVARSFQNIELFRKMTVLENLMLGRHVRMRGNVLGCGLYWGRQRREEIVHRRRVEEIIDSSTSRVRGPQVRGPSSSSTTGRAAWPPRA